uniref:Peroxisomal nicotinamide adenine dinucleotide carrier n=1 Tax=Oryza meridionalis TaxID=40149 RepID=A0A0E0CI71_9ORYZ
MSSAAVNGLAGAGGGIIAQIITYPLQTVNTRQQTERSAKKKKASGAAIANTSTLFQMLQLFQTEGWGGLYSGLKPSLIGTAASQGIYYYFYQILKNKVEDLAVARGKKGLGDGTVGMLSWLGIAAVAGSINVLLTNPIWVLVTRMQTHTQAEKKIVESKKELLLKDVARANSIEVSILKDRLYKLDSEKPRPYGTIQAVREVYRESGIRGFWKGLIPTLIMRLRSKRSGKELPKKNLTAMEVFLLGAIAKLGATVVTYPLLVVKSRLQAKQEIGRNVMSRYTGTIDAIIKMIRYEGLHGFYKGMGTKIVQSVFAASVLFMIKEELSSVVMAVGAPILSCSSRLGHLHFLLTDGGQTKYCTVKIFTEVDLVVLGEGGRVT